MAAVETCEPPPHALLRIYSNEYTDCYTTDLARRVTHADFVDAFYNTRLFKLERIVLTLIGKPSTDADARELANGQRETFAAWTVERRATDQLLLCDFQGKTRSWLMVEPRSGGTRLYFGSAVMKRVASKGGDKRMSAGFRAMLGFHKRYSRGLLGAAHRSLTSEG